MQLLGPYWSALQRTAMQHLHKQKDQLHHMSTYVSILFVSLAFSSVIPACTLPNPGGGHGSEIFFGSQCVPCTNYTRPGNFNATHCADLGHWQLGQEAKFNDCIDKPLNALWVAAEQSNNSCMKNCTWLCGAGFNEDASGQCLRCAQCRASTANFA